MRKKYLLYISVLVFIFLLTLIVWPDRNINIDIGSFHYHKVWKGPNLNEITSGRIENDLNLDLGSGFLGGTAFEYKIVYPEATENKKEIADQTLDEIRMRLAAGGYNQSDITWELRGEDYYTIARIENIDDNVSDEYIKETVFKKGVLQLWGERSQTDIGAQTTDQQANTFESFLDQNYDKIEVDANDIKGYRVFEDEETYGVKIALSDVQAEALSSSILAFFGRNLLAVLDEQFIVVDGADLGEQIQTTGKIKTLNLTGFQSKKDAKLMAGIIGNGPLGVELEQFKKEAFQAEYDRSIIGKVALAFIAVLIVFGLILITLYKIDGVVGLLMNVLWGLLVAAGLKILPVVITIPTILALGMLTGLFLWMLLKVIRSIDRKNKTREDLDLGMYFKDASVHKEITNMIYVMLILGLVCLLSSIWPGNNIAALILLSTLVSWFTIEQCVPAIYKFTALLKEKDE
ncbi:MAG: hypothetical protein PHS44_08380 [Candidatus Dojkabacteria bacterium]|nr:hypothetical protein [Candidatus Dojkabacteria bacterium]